MPAPTLPEIPNNANAAAGFGSSSASVFNAMQSALNQEAARQATRDAQQVTQDHQDQQDYFKAIQDGWVPAQAQTRMAGGMIDRTQPSSPNQDPNRMATIGKRQMYKPTDLESGKTMIPFGGLGDALKQGGAWDGKTPMTSEQTHSAMMAINEAQPKDEPSEYDNSGKYIDSRTGQPVAGFVGKKSHKFFPITFGDSAQPQAPASGGGLAGDLSAGAAAQSAPAPASPFSAAGAQPAQPGAAPTGAGAPGGPFTFAPPEKPDQQTPIQGYVGPRGFPLVNDKTSGKVKELDLPAGSKPALNANQEELSKDRKSREAQSNADRAERTGERTAATAEKAKATFRGIETTKKKAIAEAVKEYRKSMEVAVSPKDKKEALDTLRSGIDDAQTEYEGTSDDETGNHTTHNAWGKTYNPDGPQESPGRGGAATHAPPPASVTQGLGAGTHTFGNGQVWKKGADGSMTYVSGGQ